MHLIKTTILKSEMLLEFMSCVSVTFIQKTPGGGGLPYETDGDVPRKF